MKDCTSGFSASILSLPHTGRDREMIPPLGYGATSQVHVCLGPVPGLGALGPMLNRLWTTLGLLLLLPPECSQITLPAPSLGNLSPRPHCQATTSTTKQLYLAQGPGCLHCICASVDWVVDHSILSKSKQWVPSPWQCDAWAEITPVPGCAGHQGCLTGLQAL